MSASIYWSPVASGTLIEVDLPSQFLYSMRRAFGNGEKWELNETHIPVLEGMSAVIEQGDHDPYQELIEQIGRHDKIRVWADF